MIKYLGWGAHYPILKTVGEVVYYGIIIAAIFIFLVLAGKRLLALGYPKKRVVLFTALSILIAFPAGYLGSRAADMFYHPVQEWSIPLLFESMRHGSSHTFHASLILPLFFGYVFCRLTRLKFTEVFDSIFLYVPLAHAIGRFSCLLIGCCWGKHVSMHLYGLHLKFQNPIPLYAIVVNLCLFLFLRRLYETVYATAWTRHRFRGIVVGSYFGIYGAVRIVFEVFRKERKILFDLTQAQLAMGFYLLFAMAIFLAVLYVLFKHRAALKKAIRHPIATSAAGAFAVQAADGSGGFHGADAVRSTVPAEGVAGNIAADETERVRRHADALKRQLSAAGLAVAFILATFLIYYLTRQLKVWKWPIQPVLSLADAYSRILYYLPVLLIPAGALAVLSKSNEPIQPWFKWNRFSYLFLIGLAVSMYYSVELLVLSDVKLRGLAFWPPVLVLSIMNAFAEEIMYRLALVRSIIRAGYGNAAAMIVQSVIYSLIHFMVAGAVLGVLSLVYGLLLGLIAQRSKSIVPAVVCHFIIDIGCIGMPMLRI